MKGYVRNKSAFWRHALKRNIGPGHKIPLDEIYEQYSSTGQGSHEIEAGQPFVEWLKNVKLRDNNVWDVVYEPGKPQNEEPKAEEKPEKGADLVRPLVKKPLEVKDVVQMSVRQAREDLRKITDLNLLKYALGEARQLANKDTLCIMLRRRIQELEITRR
jgi:hypothetical protein